MHNRVVFDRIDRNAYHILYALYQDWIEEDYNGWSPSLVLSFDECHVNEFFLNSPAGTSIEDVYLFMVYMNLDW